MHLDLNIGKYDTPHSLDDILNKALLEWEAIYGTGVGEVTLALRFAGVVERAYKKPEKVLLFLLTNMTNLCCRLLEKENYRLSFVAP